MTALLEVRDLHVRIGSVHAVRGLSFDVHPGETLCIVGESGCGKSMTSLAVMDLLPSGARRFADRISLGGDDLAALSDRSMGDIRGRRMSMIFQDPMTSLNPSYTIGDQLEEVFLRHRAGDRADARARASHLLAKVGISAPDERLRQYPHQLSGGLRQRIMIAMALMCHPQLIIADEPTTALDVTIQIQILKLLKELQVEFGVSILLITHDMGVVARVADRILVMYAGEIVETGTPEEIFHAPAHPYTVGLLGSVLVPGRSSRGTPLRTIPGGVPNLAQSFKGCAFQERCSRSTATCSQRSIELILSSSHRGWRCIHPSLGSRANLMGVGKR